MTDPNLADNEQPIDSQPQTDEVAADAQDPVFHTDEELESELEQANARVLRAQAELENFRKRARREIEDERKYANLPLMNDLLSVLDNLERAVDAAGQSETNTGLLEGVKMVATQFLNVLEQYHCRKIDAEGKVFDPNLHEAIGQEPSEQPAGGVTRVARTGYLLHDRVVRPSQVLISSGPSAPET